MTVAALYIDPRGPYPRLLGPELCWDESRDARTYPGPHLEQVAWGHPCVKPTRIYCVGVPAAAVLSTMRQGGEPTHQIWGSRKGGHRHRTDLKAAHAAMRRRTPEAFARWLISLAEQAGQRVRR